ncbi:MAG TPA: type II secretion system secretin GspD [Alphaproteobacteria bacterium]|nr:type II secretion system secretin GspD [Alphaproteobacteria bacterium]
MSPPVRADAETAPDGDIVLNFVNADVREVARAVLGSLLKLNYVVDPRVQGTITVQTSRPLGRDAVLPTLDVVLRTSGFALTESGGLYRITPAESAPRADAAAGKVTGGRPLSSGSAIQVVPLRFTSALEVRNLIEAFLPPGAGLRADTTRNVLLLQGSREELASVLDLIEMFDMDWLSGKSFALHPLHSAQAKALIPELESIFGDPAEGPNAGVVRFIPIDRMNAILVVAASQLNLKRAQEWIDRLDRGGDEDTQRIHVYYIQNSRAVDVAAVLSELLSPRDVRVVLPATTPVFPQVELRSSRPGEERRESGAGSTSDAGTSSDRASMGGGDRLGSVSTSGSTRYGARTPRGTPGGAGLPGPSLGVGGYDLFGGPDDRQPRMRVVADEKNNALVIYATPRDYRMIEAAVRKLDVLPLQVVIEATIAEVTLNDSLRYGTQWFFKTGNNSVVLTNLRNNDIGGIFPGFNYFLSGGDARVILSALSDVTDLNVISSPTLMVLDHQTATLQVGDEVPITVQQAVSTINPDAPIVNSIQYRDTGVILRVTPRVNASGLVTLEIQQEVSDVTETTTSGIDSPTISQRRIVSNVAVQAGDTVALGGLIRDTKSKGRTGLPFLSEIPVLGFLFGTKSAVSLRTELLVMITPRVIRNPQDARDMTEELRTRLRSVGALERRRP